MLTVRMCSQVTERGGKAMPVAAVRREKKHRRSGR
jgi:hypothetical protein